MILQPCLFDKLEMSSQNQSTMNWRKIIKRDIEYLLNDSSRSGTLFLDDYREVEKSVINYGLPSLSKQVLMKIYPQSLARHINRIIAYYEPRLDPDSIKVIPIVEQSQNTILALLFDIYATLVTDKRASVFNIKIALDYSCDMVRVI